MGTTLPLNKGDVVIWNGALVHSGAGYTVPNIRLFSYVLPRGRTEDKDPNGALEYSTYPVEFHTRVGPSGLQPQPAATRPLPARGDGWPSGDTPAAEPDADPPSDDDDLDSDHDILEPRGPHAQTPPGTRTRSSNHLSPIDMDKLQTEGYLMIDDFVSLSASRFDCLERSLVENTTVLFDIDSSELFNQRPHGSTAYENDGLRRAAGVEAWKVAAATNADALAAISILCEAGSRVLQALPEGYEPADLMVIESDSDCAEQARHTDYDTDHPDFADPATAPLSLLAGISNDSKLNLWFRATTTTLQRKVIAIPRGSALLIHGAQIHGGASYSRRNYRLFAYLQRSTYAEHPRQTHPVAEE